jgi:hypothetical protein
MNSSLYAAILECWGRVEGNGALQLMTYELGSLPVPDIRNFNDQDVDAIVSATESLIAGEEGAKEELNQAVLDAVGIDSITPEELVEMRKVMTHQRLQGEFESEVLLRDLDETAEWSSEYFGTGDSRSTLDDVA